MDWAYGKGLVYGLYQKESSIFNILFTTSLSYILIDFTHLTHGGDNNIDIFSLKID